MARQQITQAETEKVEVSGWRFPIRRVILILLVGSALVGGGFWVYSAGQNSTGAELQRNQESVQQLGSELQRAKEQIQILETEKGALENEVGSLNQAIRTLEEELVVPESIFESERAAKISIGGGPYPDTLTFTRLTVSPFYGVKKEGGEPQSFSIWVKSMDGAKEVSATIKTRKETVRIPFRLVEGTKLEGRWVGVWITRDLLWNDGGPGSPTYPLDFQAIDEMGKEVKMPLLIPQNYPKRP